MSDEPYAIPENPEFDDTNIREIQNSDPVNAKAILTPLMTKILGNIRAVWQKVLTKVDEVEGKGLSANDYTNEEKQKLAGLNNYNDGTLQNAVTSLQTNKAEKTEVSASFAATNAVVGQNTAAISATNTAVGQNAAAITATNTAVGQNTAAITAANAAIAAIPSTQLTMTAPIIAGGAQALATKQVRNVTVSPSNPSGGSNGDMWFKYS